jgi:hypothetical protein
MPKPQVFPKPNRWTPPYLNAPLADDEVWLVLALDPPVWFLRQVQALQERAKPHGEGLSWVDPRDFVLPLVEIPQARTAAFSAVVSRLREAAAQIPPGRFTTTQSESSSEGGARWWVSLHDHDGVWERLVEHLARGLEQDGFSFSRAEGPRIVFAESAGESAGPLLPAEAKAPSGGFRAWDAVLYRRHPQGDAPRLEALAYAPLQEAEAVTPEREKP